MIERTWLVTRLSCNDINTRASVLREIRGIGLTTIDCTPVYIDHMTCEEGDDDGGVAIHITAERPEGVPEENWLPMVQGDYGVDIVMRLYAPDLERFKSWSAPKAEKVENK